MKSGRLERLAGLARLAPMAWKADGELAFEVLGGLKGGAQKLGQTVALVADGFPAGLKARLGDLFADAPVRPWSEMEGVLEAELGPKWRTLQLAPEPFAAASLGQVYAGQWEGKPLAVKVQYPGVADALASDLANLGMAAGPLIYATDSMAVLGGLREALLAETDYRREAKFAGQMAEAVQSWSFLVVPTVMSDFCSARVLSCERLSGVPLHRATVTKSEARSLSERLITAVLGPLFKKSLLNADAHPGNFLVLPDRRLGMVDFGAVATIPVERVRRIGVALDQLLLERTPDFSAFGLTLPAKVEADILALLKPLGPGTWDFSKDTLLQQMSDLKRRHAWSMRSGRVEPELMPLIRAITGLHYGLRMLGAEVPVGRVIEGLRAGA